MFTRNGILTPYTRRYGYVCLPLAVLLAPDNAAANLIDSPGVIAARHSGKCLQTDENGSGAVVQKMCNGGTAQRWLLKPNLDGYQLNLKNTELCMSIQTASLDEGAPVVVQNCADANTALWYARQKGDRYELAAKHSGKCLAVPDYLQDDNTALQQMTCSGEENTLWMLGALSHSAISAKHSNKCMAVTNGSAADGAAVMQNICTGTDPQQWTLQPYQDAYHLVVKHTGKCLEVENAATADGAIVRQTTCSGANNQLWSAALNGNHYSLVAKHSNKCLSVNTGSQADGEAILQATCTAADYQLWNIGAPSARAGKWSNPVSLPLVPVAAATLPNGKMLFWSADDPLDFYSIESPDDITNTALFDPSTKQVSQLVSTPTGHNMFCPGISNLPDGRIMVNGGIGTQRTSIYNPVTDSWSAAQNMNIPRGYNGNTVLSNGDVFTLGGSWSGGMGFKDGEVWNLATGWRRVTNALADYILTDDPEGLYTADNHPWLFNVGNQKVFHAGPSKQMNLFDTKGDGAHTPAGERGDDDHSMNGNAVMYGKGKILKVGGAPAYNGGSPGTANAYTIDINNGVKVTKLPFLAYARTMNNSVVLPNGQVIVFGGQELAVSFTDSRPVLAPELWDPITKNFTTLASMKIPRTYHSIALLIPDGRVVVGGGGLCGSCQANHTNLEIFTPPYLLNPDGTRAARPSITQAPATAAYGTSVAVKTDAEVKKFSMVRLSSVTHTVNNDQRRIPLAFKTTGTNSYALTIPANRGMVTPGYYMLFALNAAGVPSVAKIVQIN